MSKYDTVKKRQIPRPEGPHPIWRGIGCFMNLIIPVISYAAAYMLIDTAVTKHWPVPYQLLGYPTIPGFLYNITALFPLWDFIHNLNNLYAILAATILFVIILEAIMGVVYAFIYRANVPRYNPLDAPPPDIKVKKYKR
jgi:hypothetical protein